MKILGEKQAALKIVVDDLDSLKAQLLVLNPQPSTLNPYSVVQSYHISLQTN